MFSRRWFRYNTDEGTVYAVNRDESNTELVNITSESQAIIAAGTKPLPRGITPRSIQIASADGLQKKLCVILSPIQYASLQVGAGFAVGVNDFSGIGTAQTWTIRIKSPEISRRQPYSGDTALIDGDNP